MNLDILRALVALAWASVSAYLCYRLARLPIPPRPSGGHRGRQRDRTFETDSLAERGLRIGGGWVAHGARRWRGFGPKWARILGRAERAQLQRLMWAGIPAGLTVHESFFLMCALSVLGLVVGLFVANHEDSWAWTFPCVVMGACIVPIRLRSIASERFLKMSHEFPAVVDLAALAMNAGSDLPGAFRRVASRTSGVVADELSQLLLAFDMGVTRRAALLAFEERCPIDEVRDLVRAVLMAEQKGASVAAALSQQAQTSRQRRSVRAEEAAARAGVLLMLPLMLLMGCILIILIGPLLCQTSLL